MLYLSRNIGQSLQIGTEISLKPVSASGEAVCFQLFLRDNESNVICKVGESFSIDDATEVKVTRYSKKQVGLGIEAPRALHINRVSTANNGSPDPIKKSNDWDAYLEQFLTLNTTKKKLV